MKNRGQKKKHGRVLLHEAIAESLRRDIQRSFYPRGTYLPSEAELCARFKASRVTVRKALASLAAAGLTKAEAGIGHRVGGRLVISQQEESSLVAVLAPYAEGASYFAELVGGLERTLAEAGLHIVVYSTDPRREVNSEQLMAAQVERLLQVYPRAVVVCGERREAERAHLERLLHAEIPLVEVDEEDPTLATDFVGTDDRLGSLMVSEWLWQWSGGVVGLVLGGKPASGLELRLQGYRLALENHGVSAEKGVEVRLVTAEDQAAFANRLLEIREGERLGLFCPSHQEVMTVAGALGEAWNKVGREVGVGYVASPPWAARDPGIPVVAARWSGALMGENAGRLIARRSQREKRPPQRLLLAPYLSVDAAYGEVVYDHFGMAVLSEERR